MRQPSSTGRPLGEVAAGCKPLCGLDLSEAEFPVETRATVQSNEMTAWQNGQKFYGPLGRKVRCPLGTGRLLGSGGNGKQCAAHVAFLQR